jgi:hypothetical protein
MKYEEILDFFEVTSFDYKLAVFTIDREFSEGNITQREWAKLYQIICARDKL